MSPQLELVEGPISAALYADMVMCTEYLKKLQDLYLQQEICMRDMVDCYNAMLESLAKFVATPERQTDVVTQAGQAAQDLGGAGAERPAEGAEGDTSLGRDVDDTTEVIPGRSVGDGDADPLSEASGRRGRSDRDPQV